MPTLAERLELPDLIRGDWLEEYDAYLINELSGMFRKLFIRGKVIPKGYQSNKALEIFAANPNIDYFIWSENAPTKSGFKIVKESRIAFYRPSKSWPVSRRTRKMWVREARLYPVELKVKILSPFGE